MNCHYYPAETCPHGTEECRKQRYCPRQHAMLPQAPKRRLNEMAEYMEACALIARNGADIHNGSKELREHADMVTAIANYLSSAAETTCEPDAWMAEDGRVCTADLKRSQKPIMTAGFTIPLYRRAVKAEEEPKPCGHLRSELLAEKLTASLQPVFEMRKCLDCTKIFRVRSSLKTGGES